MSTLKTSLKQQTSSMLSNIQLSGNNLEGKQYQYISSTLNSFQLNLYKRALYGIAEYTHDEVKKLSDAEKEHILNVQRSLWEKLNIWKNKMMNQRGYAILESVFHKSQFIKDMLSIPESTKVNRKSFTQLGLTDAMVAAKIVELGFLPKNFFALR